MMKEVAKRARSGRWWERQVRAAFSDRWALKITALALAIVLWFSVTVREPAEQTVTVTFVPTLESGITLREPPPVIRAVVRGSGRDLLKLYSTPPTIRMTIGGSVGDSLNLSLRPADVDLPPGVTAVVRDVLPRRLTLTLARARTQTRGGAWARPSAPEDPGPTPRP
ncbi:MAG: hypothetical protein H0X64_06100 [Gemmatimonadaceae bacterium]|nr:hypothetical protein [Gemmatimonadaceae bacterium]